MDVKTRENRKLPRFTRCVAVEISKLGRTEGRCRGTLVDSSASGIGLFAPHPLKTGTVFILRTCEEALAGETQWAAEAGAFHLLTARVRWCREDFSADGKPGYRIGAERLLPVH
jgi:hypothetical protein